MVNRIFTNPQYRDRRKELRLQSSKGEWLLWQKIRSKQIGWKFRRQHSIGIYIADFFCSEVQLVVEVDGISHENIPQARKDTQRDSFFLSLGITTKRYTSEQIFLDRDVVVQDICNTCDMLVGR
jgi:very-short-patch-repair endonuclease